MTPPDFTAILTSERTTTTHTGASEHPSRDEIARLAYSLYEARGRRDGHDVEDWLSAEQLLARASGSET